MTKRRMGLLLLGLALTAFAAAAEKPKATPTPPAAPLLAPSKLKAFKARSIGPAVMGGRVSDIALDLENPYVFYLGFATGGVAKTSNNGGTFQAVFDKEAVASIGAVAVAPSDPKTVWVGSGEANDRNSSAWGDGVYLSTDGGDTWANVGLKDSKAIARIAVDPKDPKTAWVAAAGTPLGAREATAASTSRATAERPGAPPCRRPAPYGDRVGCGDVALDPSDPGTIYAALYARQRRPWSFTSGPAATDGKDLGGIFKSTDGGATWKKLEKGPALADRPHRPRRLEERPAHRLRDRAVGRGRHEQHRRGPEQERRRLPLGRRRRDLDAHEPAQPEAVLLLPDPRRPREPRARVRARLRAPRLGRRRQVVPRGPLREDPPGQPRPGHRPAPPQTAPARDRRRRLPELRRREELGAPEPIRRGRVLPDQPRHERPVSDLRRAPGQPELGRAQPHALQGRDPELRLDQHRRRRRLLLRVRPQRLQPRLCRVPGGRASTGSTCRPASSRACARLLPRASPASASTGTRP